jgi:hypothetical protein
VAFGQTGVTLDAAVIIQDGGSDLDVGSYSAPESCDWNNDGKKDLIAGHFGTTLKLYLNGGTDAAPALNYTSTVPTITNLNYG